MDRYKKLMCVKGLIISLDEQMYRVDQKKDMASEMEYGTLVEQYYKSIIEFLNKEETNEEAS